AANLHLDYSTPNFGIQEWCGMETDPRVQEVFTGMPYIKNGFAYLSEAPGLGVDIDEAAARKYPCDASQPRWLLARLPDGTSSRA
ncbi:MAG: enolase C-terminal domain-like protein, partial [Candidatus Fimadaptatus sp.]